MTMRALPWISPVYAAMLAFGCGENTQNIQHIAAAETSQCQANGISVSDAWMRPVRAGQPTSAAYFKLCNGGDLDDALVAVSFASAGAAELHVTSMGADGVSSMARATEVSLPAGEAAMLEPGGAHIMLIGFTEAIEPGEKPLLRLEFRNAPPLDIVLEVRAENQ